MANVSIGLTLPDAYMSRIVDGVAYENGYQDQIEDPENPGEYINNPVSKASFAKQAMADRCIDYIRLCVKRHESAEAKRTVVNEVDGMDMDATQS